MNRSFGEVSGHYAGLFTRFAAFVVDWVVIVFSYGVILTGAQLVAEALFSQQVDVESANPLWYWIGFGTWSFVYQVVGLSITGRTVGKALLGLRVVTRQGAPLSPGRATLRTLVLPLSFGLLGLGLLGIVMGRERRALHDVVSRCAVVYDWGDRPAEMPAPLTRYLERRGVGLTADAASGEAEPAAKV